MRLQEIELLSCQPSEFFNLVSNEGLGGGAETVLSFISMYPKLSSAVPS